MDSEFFEPGRAPLLPRTISSRLDPDRLGPFLLTSLALFLPFEIRTPVLQLGYAQVTDVEALLYLVLIIWGIGRCAGRWRCWSACHAGVLCFAMVVLLSALVAPFERGAALKFALRSLGGCALFFAAADLTNTGRRARRYAAAVALGAAVSAAAGCAEAAWPGAVGWLGLFKTQPSMIGGYLRASGTFQYANIAAMYWEAAAPLFIALALAHGDRNNGPWRPWLLPGALLLTMEAIMLSMSRAAIVLATALLVACLMLAWFIAPARRRAIVVCALASLLPLPGHLLMSPSFRLRLRTPDESSWYRASYAVALEKRILQPGEEFMLPMRVRNLGTMTWPAGGARRVTLSYHWEDPRKGGFILWDGIRTPLPANVPPGMEVELRAHIQAPPLTGTYILHVDMAHEGANWFSLRGSPSLEIPAVLGSVEPKSTKLSGAIPLFRPEVIRNPSRPELWLAALKMWASHPVLGVGPDNFRLVRGRYEGLTGFDVRIHSNNLYLETIANLGSMGLLALAAVMFSTLALGWRMWRAAGSARAKLFALGLGASVAAFYIHGFVDYFLEFTPTYTLFWLLTGITAGLSRARSGS